MQPDGPPSRASPPDTTAILGFPPGCSSGPLILTGPQLSHSRKGEADLQRDRRENLGVSLWSAWKARAARGIHPWAMLREVICQNGHGALPGPESRLCDGLRSAGPCFAEGCGFLVVDPGTGSPRSCASQPGRPVFCWRAPKAP